MSFLGEKHCNMFNANKEFLLYCIVFPYQVLNFLNIFTEHGKIITNYTKSIERISQLLCGNVIVERL